MGDTLSLSCTSYSIPVLILRFTSSPRSPFSALAFKNVRDGAIRKSFHTPLCFSTIYIFKLHLSHPLTLSLCHSLPMRRSRRPHLPARARSTSTRRTSSSTSCSSSRSSRTRRRRTTSLQWPRYSCRGSCKRRCCTKQSSCQSNNRCP